MKVKDLIELLKNVDENLNVVVIVDKENGGLSYGSLDVGGYVDGEDFVVCGDESEEFCV